MRKLSFAATQSKMSQEQGEFDLHVAKRYQMDKRLGRGAYGIVWKAKSRKSERVVSLILRNRSG